MPVRGSPTTQSELPCAPGFQRGLERGITSLLSWAFQTQALKSLREQLLIITQEFVCVILSHSKKFLWTAWVKENKS